MKIFTCVLPLCNVIYWFVHNRDVNNMTNTLFSMLCDKILNFKISHCSKFTIPCQVLSSKISIWLTQFNGEIQIFTVKYLVFTFSALSFDRQMPVSLLCFFFKYKVFALIFIQLNYLTSCPSMWWAMEVKHEKRLFVQSVLCASQKWPACQQSL